MHSPSISAHSFFIAAGAGMILRFRRGLPAFSGARAAAPGVSSLGWDAAAASSAGELALPDGDGTRQQGTAGGNHDGGAPGAALGPVPFAQRLLDEAGGEHGQDDGRGNDAQALDQVGRRDARPGEGQDQQRPVPEVERVGVVPQRHQGLPAQEAVDAEPAAALAGGDDRGGGQRGPQRDEVRGRNGPRSAAARRRAWPPARPSPARRAAPCPASGTAGRGPGASRGRTPRAGRRCRSRRGPGSLRSAGSSRPGTRRRWRRRPRPAGTGSAAGVVLAGPAAEQAGKKAVPAKTSGQSTNTWPWIESDQKCWSGLAPEWSWA